MLASDDFVAQAKAAIAQLTDPEILPPTVDLSSCDRESIHTPAAIQPHGVLLALVGDHPPNDPPPNNRSPHSNASTNEWIISQLSHNTAEHLGTPPEALLNQPLSRLLNPEQIQALETCLEDTFDSVSPLKLDIAVAGSQKSFYGAVHYAVHYSESVDDSRDRPRPVVILELEPNNEPSAGSFF
ncbi:MAG: hypothetical protein WBD47_07105, partial [Phormidesmis sp.]